jgi:hypothetical protein
MNRSVQFGQLPAVRIVVAALPDLLLVPIAAGHRGLAARSGDGALDADAGVGVSLPLDVYEHAVGANRAGQHLPKPSQTTSGWRRAWLGWPATWSGLPEPHRMVSAKPSRSA